MCILPESAGYYLLFTNLLSIFYVYSWNGTGFLTLQLLLSREGKDKINNKHNKKGNYLVCS